jgi:prepilin-type N-terminal cleavage/methylation domain-containing protein
MLNALGMSIRPVIRQSDGMGRRGFTMIELALTLTLIAIMTAMMVPKIGRVMQATRINREVAIVVQDLEQAFTLAARYRKPMRLSCTCGTQTYTIADRTGGTVRLSRRLGADADLGTLTLTFSASPVDIFPSGVATAPDTVRITSGTSTRAVVLTTGGQVRIIP